mmetsp:Transcript_18685/g.27036  ORF Transcript_18685/g.27036 Transcript_18685/m.27036 type:complete len:109 (+) Transcript_18685:74-400(+)
MSQITPLPIADPVDVDGEETVTPTAVEVRALRDALAEANARADANAARALAEANARQFYQRRTSLEAFVIIVGVALCIVFKDEDFVIILALVLVALFCVFIWRRLKRG